VPHSRCLALLFLGLLFLSGTRRQKGALGGGLVNLNLFSKCHNGLFEVYMCVDVYVLML